MDQPNQQTNQPLEEIKLEVKRMIFESWKNEIGKDNGTREPIQEPIEEEPKHDILPTETTEDEKEVKIVNVEAEEEKEVKIIDVEAEQEPCDTELMPLTETDKKIIEQVEQIIAPARSKRTKQKLVNDDKPPPVIKKHVKPKEPKPKLVTLVANQLLQIKLPEGQATCNPQFI